MSPLKEMLPSAWTLEVQAHRAGLAFSMDCGLMFLTKFGNISDLFKQEVSWNHISSVDLLSEASLFTLRSCSIQCKTCPSRGTRSSAWSQKEPMLSHLWALTLVKSPTSLSFSLLSKDTRIKLANAWNTRVIFKMFNGGID